VKATGVLSFYGFPRKKRKKFLMSNKLNGAFKWKWLMLPPATVLNHHHTTHFSCYSISPNKFKQLSAIRSFSIISTSLGIFNSSMSLHKLIKWTSRQFLTAIFCLSLILMGNMTKENVNSIRYLKWPEAFCMN
jgi:hypothetical protein